MLSTSRAEQTKKDLKLSHIWMQCYAVKMLHYTFHLFYT